MSLGTLIFWLQIIVLLLLYFLTDLFYVINNSNIYVYAYAIIIFFKESGVQSIDYFLQSLRILKPMRALNDKTVKSPFSSAFAASVAEWCFLPYLRFWVTRVSGGYLFTRSADAAHLCVTVIYSNITPNEKCRRSTFAT